MDNTWYTIFKLHRLDTAKGKNSVDLKTEINTVQNKGQREKGLKKSQTI